MNEKFQELAKPFEPEYISWLPGATNKNQADPKCMAMAYADLRAYMYRLDSVFGCDWSSTITPWGDRLIVSVTINGMTRSSTGEPDSESIKNGNAGTVTEAQAFKRACAMWGLGRYLYEFKSEWVKFDPNSKKIVPTDLDRLNRTYKQWYDKAQAPKPVMPAPEHAVKVEPVAISEKSRKQLHAVGTKLYGEAWDTKRHEIVAAVTEGRTNSSAELYESEAKKLIDGINGRLDAMKKAA